MTKEELKTYIEKWATKYEIDPAIVFGIVMKESQGLPWAIRYEPAYKWLFEVNKVKPSICSVYTEEMLQKCSWGLMQVMGAVFREYGFEGWLTELATDIDRQIQYGTKHLAKKIKKYGVDRGISAYNAGVPISGNREYVEEVKKYARAW
jgi:soluble lytic murein transglycosylase-like protein